MNMDFIVGIGAIILFVLIMRSFGAWMLRIDEVIDTQKEILKELKDRKEKTESEKETGNFSRNLKLKTKITQKRNWRSLCAQVSMKNVG